jgi:tryptophan-rich sensory protein
MGGFRVGCRGSEHCCCINDQILVSKWFKRLVRPALMTFKILQTYIYPVILCFKRISGVLIK